MSLVGEYDKEEVLAHKSLADLNSGWWQDIPDSLLLYIFSFLDPREVLTASRVCRNWNRAATDEVLWKFLFIKVFELSDVEKASLQLPSSSSLWIKEFQRIYYETPLIEAQVLDEHTDEVLHVTFSHNGEMFASSSKDCHALLWDVTSGEAVVKERLMFKQYGWEYVQFCEFNRDDTLLLVSGVNEMRRLNFMGEIIICDLESSSLGNIVHAVISEPYDVFGAWLTERYFISGRFEFMVPTYDSSISELCANNVKNEPPLHLCRIFNESGSSVRTVLVGRPSFLEEDEVFIIFTHGNVTYTPHQVVFKKIKFKSQKPGEIKILSDDKENNSPFTNGQDAMKNDRDEGSSDSEDIDTSYTKPDHIINTFSHIIGMSLSPEQDLLYVNCRPWSNAQNVSSDQDVPPEITNSIHLRVYSLSSFELIREHIGHQAFTPNDKCFFIFLNVADKLVASGAEDACAHVWDRHFGMKLASLEAHEDVVNCVAFNPQDPEMLISASDDRTLRVWKSRRKATKKKTI